MRILSGRTQVLVLVLSLVALSASGAAAPLQDTTSNQAVEFRVLINRLRAVSGQRDSLAVLTEVATGEMRSVRDEQVWERQVDVDAGLVAVAENLRRQLSLGRDLSEPRRVLNQAIREGWPKYRDLLRRSQKDFATLRRERDAVSGAQRLAVEARMSDLAERRSSQYRALVVGVLALERVGVDVAEQRAFVTEQLTALADVLVTRIRVAERERVTAAAQVARAPTDATLKQELEVIDERLRRACDTLDLALDLMDRLGLETTRFKVFLITSTGKITADVFNLRVIRGLLSHARTQLVDALATQAPRWLFHALVLVLILAGFRLLASLTRRLVRHAVARSPLSQLLRETLIASSSRIVMLIGVIVVLTQLGVQVGALLAGLGIAGFVLGFAMQDTLSNFAAGGMILAYRPFDLGDVIEAAGVSGTVKAMSLVATTILTFDNQTLIVPNSKIWGGVIRNITAQSMRRVDLTFGIGYADDLEKAERVLNEVVTAHDKVLADPPPVIRLNQLGDSSVNFVVRPWTLTEHYWDVYWDITRTVKLRFDQEGITIPFPQRDLHVHMIEAGKSPV